VFSLIQILVSALVGVIASFVMLWLYGRWARNTAPRRIDAVLIAIVVGISILLWREAGNTATLNDDPIPLVSPNDVLCPVITYLCLSVLAGFRSNIQGPNWPRIRALLTLLSLVVNVATI
jgi:peptidoglycan/LPS O-acetylase OafA/YrhL